MVIVNRPIFLDKLFEMKNKNKILEKPQEQKS